MSDLDAETQRQAFPILTDEQIALLRPFGEVQATKAGDVLFEAGDATYPLVVVLSGQTKVVDRSEGSDQLITTTGPGGFNGELGLLTGQTVFATCIVREPGEVLLIPPASGPYGDRDDPRAERRADHGVRLASPAPDAGRVGDADPDRT